MPIDPQARRILGMLNIGGTVTRDQLSVAAIRRSMQELAQALDPRDLDAVNVEQQELALGDRTLAVRVYRAVGGVTGARDATLASGLVYFHGGAGVFGSVSTHDAVCRMLAQDGQMTVLSLEYRLAPEAPYPAALEDCWESVCQLAARAQEFGIHADRLAIGGDSAGATLATVVCQRARNARSPKLAAQLLLCPVTDLCAEGGSREEYAEGYFPSHELLQWATDLYCPAPIDRRQAELSPLRAPDLSQLPPAFIHTAEFDPLRDEGIAYARSLERAGVAVHHTDHAGLVHHFYGMAGGIRAARSAMRELAREFGQALARPAAQA